MLVNTAFRSGRLCAGEGDLDMPDKYLGSIRHSGIHVFRLTPHTPEFLYYFTNRCGAIIAKCIDHFCSTFLHLLLTSHKPVNRSSLCTNICLWLLHPQLPHRLILAHSFSRRPSALPLLACSLTCRQATPKYK